MMRDFARFLRHLLHSLRVVRGVLLVLGLGLLACVIAIVLAEGQPFGQAVYFVLITGLTVGYGDIAPTTAWGQVASVVAGVIGVINVGIIVAVANIALGRAVDERRSELRNPP
jgi:voltage-gated potassium channel